MHPTRPSTSALWQKTYVSYRRLWLDYYLEQFSPEMRGTVFDLGGKRENKRGSFRPPEAQAAQWWYLNLGLSTRPNILGDVTQLPLEAASADVILCTEVLEHLRHPAACVAEIERLLKPGGTALVSIPFIFPIHADPDDFQRFTADGLRQLFGAFASLEILPMGAFWGTLGMFLEIGLLGLSGQELHHKLTRRSLSWLSQRLCALDLERWPETQATWQKFTTGYFIKANK
jgi:SAM-dependent methyltransferase